MILIYPIDIKSVSNYLYSIYAGNWTVDQRTGKQYLVLDSTNEGFATIRQQCNNFGGFLPEPKDELENNYLDSLTKDVSDMFYLGLRDQRDEGQWLWETDRSEVMWMNWAEFTGEGEVNPPNGGRTKNCAVMLKNANNDKSGHSSKAWGDRKCAGKTVSVVCEQGKGNTVTAMVGLAPKWVK